MSIDARITAQSGAEAIISRQSHATAAVETPARAKGTGGAVSTRNDPNEAALRCGRTTHSARFYPESRSIPTQFVDSGQQTPHPLSI